MIEAEIEQILTSKHTVGKRKLALLEYTGSALWIIENEMENLHGCLVDSDLNDETHQRIEGAIGALEHARELIDNAEGWLSQLELEQPRMLA